MILNIVVLDGASLSDETAWKGPWERGGAPSLRTLEDMFR